MLKQKFDDYQVTVAPFGNQLGLKMNIAHAIVGMASEEGEIREVFEHRFHAPEFFTNLVAELGDALWFAAWFATSQEKSFGEAMLLVSVSPTQYVSSRVHALSVMDLAGCEMLSEMKRVLFYEAEDYRWPELNEHYLTYLSALNQFIELMGMTFSDLSADTILAANVAKLSTRYPDKVFSKDSALVRDTTSEDSAVALNLSSTI